MNKLMSIAICSLAFSSVLSSAKGNLLAAKVDQVLLYEGYTGVL